MKKTTGYISKKQFRENYGISAKKAKQMLPYIKGARQCSLCHNWEIPTDAKPIYIPNKSFYRKDFKKYAYVMDAISLGFQIHPELSNISNDVCKTIVEELIKSEAIVLINGRNSNSLNYYDYIPSAAYISWKDECIKRKNQMILEILKTIQSITKITSTINTI